MSELFGAFGLDWRLLLVNILNFSLLLAVLWYVLYEPLMRTLDERKARIAKGVSDAKAAEDFLAEVDATRSTRIAEAGKEAEALVAAARVAASKKEAEALEHGEKRVSALMSEAEAAAAELKRRALDESRQEVAKLVVLGLEQSWSKK